MPRLPHSAANFWDGYAESFGQLTVNSGSSTIGWNHVALSKGGMLRMVEGILCGKLCGGKREDQQQEKEHKGAAANHKNRLPQKSLQSARDRKENPNRVDSGCAVCETTPQDIGAFRKSYLDFAIFS
jgi:hypothetical protein